MDDAVSVCVVERSCDLARDAERVINIELTLAIKSFTEGFTFYVRHHVVE